MFVQPRRLMVCHILQEMEKFKQDLLLKQKAEEAEYKRKLDNELSIKLNP